MRYAFVAAICLFLSLGATRAFAQEQKFEKYNFAITPPKEWKAGDPDKLPANSSGKFVAAYFRPDGREIISVMVSTSDESNAVLNDKAEEMLWKSFNDRHGDMIFTSGTYTQMAGMKGYETRGTITANGTTGSLIDHWVWTEHDVYLVQTINWEKKEQSAEVLACVASFRLLTPPNPSSSTDNGVARSGDGENRSVAYRAGYAMGNLMLIALIVWFVCYLLRKKPAPPLPPQMPRTPPPTPRSNRPPPPVP